MRIEELLSSLLGKVLNTGLQSVPAMSLPHEPESRDDSRTFANVNIDDVREKWLNDWQVPEEHRPYWRQFKIVLSHKYGPGIPAATSAQVNTMWIRPEWANPGVIAHELAHESYSLLTERMKAAFKSDLESLKNKDGLLRLLFTRISYANNNIVETHAEVYRYLGERMPETLKKYYPKML
jgi:hypothetical protein